MSQAAAGMTSDQMQTLCNATKQLDVAVNRFIDAFVTKFGQVTVNEATAIDDQATAITQLIHKVEADVSLVNALRFAFQREVLDKIGDWQKSQ